MPPLNLKDDMHALSISAEPFSDTLVRTALLFSDVIDCPGSSIATLSYMPDTLIDADVWQSSFLQTVDTTNRQVSRLAFKTFKALETREPLRWSIWQVAGQQAIPDDELTTDLALRMRLQDAIAVPHRDVPYEEVLQFKQQRLPELQALRICIDEVAMKVAQTGDPRSAELEIEKLDRAIKEHTAAARDKNWAKSLVNLDVEVNWTDLAVKAMGTSAISAIAAVSMPSIALPTAAAAFAGWIGSIGSAITFKSTYGLRRVKTDSPFSYIVDLQYDL